MVNVFKVMLLLLLGGAGLGLLDSLEDKERGSLSLIAVIAVSGVFIAAAVIL